MFNPKITKLSRLTFVAVGVLTLVGCSTFHAEERKFREGISQERASLLAQTYKQCMGAQGRQIAGTHRPALQNTEALHILREQAGVACAPHLDHMEKELVLSDLFSRSFVSTAVETARVEGDKQFMVDAFRSN